AISWETGHLQDGRYKTWRDIPGAGDSVGTRVAEKNRQYLNQVKSTPGGIPTKPVRKVGIRKP
ncbi:MAG: hypothetical protein EB079_06815, partial [Verrucomicrobia bacterium]|nr:hypothetical protein [Verrucomicrobiota bacterium]